MKIDVASGGELFVALAAGVPASRCVFHGNNKSVGELTMAIEAGIGTIVVDSFDELDRLDALLGPGGPLDAAAPQRVMIRVTPGIEVHTFDEVQTGQEDSKFGFGWRSGAAKEAAARVQASAWLDLVGLHMHRVAGALGRQLRPRRRERRAARAPTRSRGVLRRGWPRGGLRRGRGRCDDQPVGPGRSRGVRRRRHRRQGDRRARSVDRRAGRRHAVHRRHDQAARGHPHLRVGRRRNERQSAPVLYGRATRRSCPVPSAPSDRDGPRRRKAPKSATCWCDGVVPDDLSIGDIQYSRHHLQALVGSNYNKVFRPPVVFVRRRRSCCRPGRELRRSGPTRR